VTEETGSKAVERKQQTPLRKEKAQEKNNVAKPIRKTAIGPAVQKDARAEPKVIFRPPLILTLRRVHI
jgi:hypothetical protein